MMEEESFWLNFYKLFHQSVLWNVTKNQILGVLVVECQPVRDLCLFLRFLLLQESIKVVNFVAFQKFSMNEGFS